MRTSSRGLALLVVIIAPLLAFYSTVASAAMVTVMVGPNCLCFVPPSVTIHRGDTVQWTWSSTGHSTTSGNPGVPNGLWDSGLLNQGATFSHTFNTAGSFPYYCSAHWQFGMTGTVTVVNPTPTPTPNPTPTVTTNPATNVASFSATLNGSLNPHGSTTTVYFQYGPTTSYGLTTPMQTQTGNTFRNISANISGLMASHLYHFRIVAHNSGGTSFGSDRTFTTLGATGPPVVTTNPATLIASFSATLNGSLDPHGLATTVHFQYGTTTSYGLTTAPQSHNGNTYLNISANISSLSANTIYHYRIVASNSAGTRFGADRIFTTLTATGPPVVTTNPATNVATSSATLNGSLDPHGLATTVRFQYGTTTSYGHTTAMQSQTGNTYRNIAANISGLTTHTNYHFRIVATNSAGTRMGGDRTFTTP
jgi:plastocyanin